MVEAHSSSIAPRPWSDRLGHGHAPSVMAMLEAFHVPAAILAQSGEVLAGNAAWDAAASAADETAAPVGENYLDWCQTFLSDGASLAAGGERVLTGKLKAWDRRCRMADGTGSLCVRIRAIERTAPTCFLVSHEPLAATPAEEELEDRVLAAQIQERERLATDLHDSVGQNLVCLGLGLTRLRRAAEPESELAGIVGDMTQSLQQAHAEIRTLSFLLQPPWLDAPGAFEGAIRDLVAGFARRAGLQASVQVEGRIQGLCKARELTLFRIVQEALVNVYRHAKADQVEVELACRARRTVLKVRDNGRGMPAPEGAAPAPGVGILSMRARLRQFGGDLCIVSGPDGTTVTAKLPATHA